MKTSATLFVTLLFPLSGCGVATVPARSSDAAGGAVIFEDVSGLSANTDRLSLAPNESFLVPLTDPGNLLPSYPSELLSLRLPAQVVCVDVAIDVDGAVSMVRPARPSSPCPGAYDQRFSQAVEASVKDWKYEPALRCVFPDVKTKENTYSSCSGGKEIAQAITLTYRFVFEQVDGQPTVKVGR